MVYMEVDMRNAERNTLIFLVLMAALLLAPVLMIPALLTP